MAMSVPSAVATSVARSADLERRDDGVLDAETASQLTQLSSVNPCHT